MPSVADLVEPHLLRSLSDDATVAAGQALARLHTVALEVFGPMTVRATVRDEGEAFLVDLHVGPGSRLAWTCSEPGGSRGDFCRHCVAVAVVTWDRAPDRPSTQAGTEPLTSPPTAVAAPPVPPPPAALPVPPSPPPAPAPEPAPAGPAPVPPTPTSAPHTGPLLSGAHTVLFSPEPEELREFLQHTLGLAGVDAGAGWLIFALPPAEVAVHPAETPGQGLYLLCDDLEATLVELAARGFRAHTPIHEESWGLVTELALPGGGELPLYQPRHPRPSTPA